ncbi:hypothetical protein [Flavobacterium sp. B183]|uniref:hypothetical protein n=1 Tax=Flavobacterium sp. B183 TaxID=907046 RepID=UPI00201E74EF|nr:hypothetical protein [Flavobacterium sp. B183]URC11717.1 hypothetical protein M4I44_16650 [Flavobacterium sp. B183]
MKLQFRKINIVLDKEVLHIVIQNIDKKINQLNDEKIIAFIESLDLDKKNISKDYLNWEMILIVVPTRKILNELTQYKSSIYRISFVTNPNAEQIHIYDLNEWKNNTLHKSKFQIREFLKTNFGGVQKNTENPDWIKLI